MKNCSGFTLLLCCTQAKLFITKGMVFNITLLLRHLLHGGVFSNHEVFVFLQRHTEMLMVDTER